ncbi:MAG: hypothetical protein R3B13_30195 [Polyangiaceae bacterium]
MKSLGLTISGFAVALTVVGAASANCAMPIGYQVKVEGNTVTVCAQNFTNRGCPDSGGMLRQTPGGDTVQLGDYCVDSCYVDECVPKGEHRYGFATPYDCCSSCCGTDYFATASVTADPPSGCMPTSGNPGTQTFNGTLPWGDDPSICGYQGGAGSPATGGASGGAGAPAASGGSSDDGGCAVRPLGAREVVFGVNALLLALGLGLSARRRLRK